jgi:hypothetical protein
VTRVAAANTNRPIASILFANKHFICKSIYSKAFISNHLFKTIKFIKGLNVGKRITDAYIGK